MTTYAIRREPYADEPELWHVFTLTADGYKHTFGSGGASYTRKLAADLTLLSPETISVLVGDCAPLTKTGKDKAP